MLLPTSQSPLSHQAVFKAQSEDYANAFRSYPFMPRYLGVRHLLKLDIFLTSVEDKVEQNCMRELP